MCRGRFLRPLSACNVLVSGGDGQPRATMVPSAPAGQGRPSGRSRRLGCAEGSPPALARSVLVVTETREARRDAAVPACRKAARQRNASRAEQDGRFVSLAGLGLVASVSSTADRVHASVMSTSEHAKSRLAESRRH